MATDCTLGKYTAHLGKLLETTEGHCTAYKATEHGLSHNKNTTHWSGVDWSGLLAITKEQQGLFTTTKGKGSERKTFKTDVRKNDPVQSRLIRARRD